MQPWHRQSFLPHKWVVLKAGSYVAPSCCELLPIGCYVTQHNPEYTFACYQQASPPAFSVQMRAHNLAGTLAGAAATLMQLQGATMSNAGRTLGAGPNLVLPVVPQSVFEHTIAGRCWIGCCGLGALGEHGALTNALCLCMCSPAQL